MVTMIVPCTKRLLDRINRNLKWASMRIKPSKSSSMSLYRGKVSDSKFLYIVRKFLQLGRSQPRAKEGGIM